MAMDGWYAEKAGAIFGLWPWTAGMPKKQEQFSAYGHGWLVCRQEQLPAVRLGVCVRDKPAYFH